MNQTDAPDNVDAPANSAGDSPYSLFRNRDFTLFLVGRFIAVFGQQMASVAVDWEIYERTHSTLALGLVGLSQMVAIVLWTLPAGYIADNFNRKRVVLLMDLLICASALSLTLISASKGSVACIYISLTILGSAKTILWPANASFLPHIVSREQFPRAVTFNSGTFQLAQMLGFTSGGFVVWLTRHAWPVYSITVVTSLAYFVMLTCIRREHKPAARQPFSLAVLSAGIYFIFENKIILGVITLDLFAVLLGGATSLFPVYAKDILKSGPSGLGILTAAMPVGAVLCTLILSHRAPMQKAGRAMLLSVAAFGLTTIIFGVANQNVFGPAIPNAVWFWLAFLMMVICGAVDNISVVVRHSLVQLLAPDEKRGRISAINSLFIGTSNELGGFESGFTAWLFGKVMGNSNATGSIVSVTLGGVGTILVVLAVGWIWPQVRRYGKLG
ncbi:MAG TPA: MFS transporter [Candidatus Acidoferrales bacterium]|nr:MFS transporter [Candidatus Acidoferrales bacterium]